MDRTIKISLIISILLIVVFSFILIHVVKNEKYNYEDDYYNTMQKMEHAETALKQRIVYDELKIDTVWLSGKDSEMQLENYVGDSTLFILFYPQHFCGECFQKELDRYNVLAEEFEGKVVLLSTGLSKRDLLFFQKKHSIQGALFPIQTTQQELFQEMIEPCFFLLDKRMRIRHFFNPDPDFQEMSEMYFQKVKSILSTENKRN